MPIAAWPCPSGGTEYAVLFDRGRAHRLLILPAWFDEANKLRRLTVETMRRLDVAGIDSFLPDLPGCNESLAPLADQRLEVWHNAANAAAAHFGANRVLTVRAGAMLAPTMLGGWRYAPLAGNAALRGLLRARSIAAREAGVEEKQQTLLGTGLSHGLELAGYCLGAGLIGDLHSAELQERPDLADIAQSTLGGGGLWLRAEPDFDADQADALSQTIVRDLTP